MEGLIGLRQNINNREAALSDLSVLERMESRVEDNRNKEVLAQQQEQAFYENIYAMSDEMLEKDRVKINAKVSMFQKQIKNHLSDFGGSRKAFMENGGLSVMNNIKNEISRSPESIAYQENKKNLSKILELQQKGMGHLLSPNDKRSLEDYQNNEDGGRITFSGMLNEIKIPPSANFDYGTDIPMDKIMSFEGNAVKVAANYKIANPDMPTPNANQLKAFAKQMGYGGTGSNQTRMRAEMEERKARIKASAKAKSASSKQPKKQFNALTGWATSKNNMDKPQYSELQASREKTGMSFMEQRMSKDPSLKQLIGNKSTIQPKYENLDEKGWDWTGNTLFEDNLRLQESFEFLPLHSDKIASAVLSEENFKVENGQIIDFEPTPEMFRMDGVQMSGDQELEKGEYKGNYKVRGTYTAMKTTIDGKPELLIEATDGDGNISENSQKDINSNYDGKMGGSQPEMTTVIAMENEDGQIFYKEFKADNSYSASFLNEEVGKSLDLTDEVNTENQYQSQLNNIKKATGEQAQAIQQVVDETDELFVNNPMFTENEASQYYGQGSGGSLNRMPLMKSFYLAFNSMNGGNPENRSNDINYLIENSWFTEAAINGDIENELKDYSQGNTEETIIYKWLENMNNDEELSEMDKQANTELAMKWKQLRDFM